MQSPKLTGPIAGKPFSILGGYDLGATEYTGEEWFLSGTACSYAQVGERSRDGEWQAHRNSEAEFETRIVVRRPEDPARFNGTVFVEWFNVTGGLDAAPDWLFSHRHIMREGAAWVGVSAQKAGIDGGGLMPGRPLKQADPERYGRLRHPGDAFAYDIFSQVGRILREPGAGPLGAARAERLIAMGESQSAGFLVTYVNAVDPLDAVFDAFLIHGRPGEAARLDGTYVRTEPGADAWDFERRLLGSDRVRTEPRVPVITLQSETDVVLLGSGKARQPDSERFALWEMAGAAHFDTSGLILGQIDDGGLSTEQIARAIAPTAKPMGLHAAQAINSGPQQRYITQAALHHLEQQLRSGELPPRAERLEVSDPDAQKLVRDELGIVKGGIRSPWVDAPTAVLSGLGQTGGEFMVLFGTTRELSNSELEHLYPGGMDDHLARFEAATTAAITAGFLLEADAEEIRALGRLGRQPSGWRTS
jgi:hypothetical protein